MNLNFSSSYLLYENKLKILFSQNFSILTLANTYIFIVLLIYMSLYIQHIIFFYFFTVRITQNGLK